MQLSHSSREPPFALAAVLSLCNDSNGVTLTPSPRVFAPELALTDGSEIVGEHAIMRHIARMNPKGSAVYGANPGDAVTMSAIDQWMDFSLTYLADSAVIGAKVLEKHLSPRTYLVGFAPTLADVAVWNALRALKFTPTTASVTRWYKHCETIFGAAAQAHLNKAAEANAKAGSGASAGGDDAGSCPPLEGAEHGKVVTRFPPEPSGYLHIGHVKACLLNNYYARHYDGTLIVRFDDTNPSKEKEEFEENIITDLATLGIKPDRVTHTSDHFDNLLKQAERMIREGKAYLDDTPQEQMRQERMDGIDGPRRGSTAEDNLAKWKDFVKGKLEGYCLRAKIDMQAKNKTLRDPVLYRANATPHNRTGTKFKVYPTYDFCCPIVDADEGVTHALRTTEYNDRDAQYHWIQDALGLRTVRIHAFARLNFVYSVLSKRKLQWFVDNGHVEGWFDPRFPTVQGIVRRGVTIDALKKFMYAQGASRRIVDMEWDKFWGINKKVIDPVAPRYFGIAAGVAGSATAVLKLTNGPSGLVGKEVQLHPKNKEVGTKVMRLGSELLLELDDAAAMKEGEEITLMRWGNAVVRKITKGADGSITLEGELHLDGDVKKTDKKVCWLPADEDNVRMVLTEFDFLVTKKKFEEGDNYQDHLRETTKAETEAIGEPSMRNLQHGDIVQIERRGFFRVDRPAISDGKPLVLFAIPDGKTKAMSSLSTKLAHR